MDTLAHNEKSLLEYEDLSLQEKNYIDTIYDLILAGDLESANQISPNYSILYVTFIKALIKLKHEFHNFQDMAQSESSYRQEMPDFDNEIKKQINSMLALVVNINQKNKELKEEMVTEEEPTAEETQSLLNSNACLIFLTDKGQPVSSLDLEELSNDAVNLKDYEKSLFELMNLSKLDMAQNNTKLATILPPRNNKVFSNYPKKTSFYRIRNRDVRIAFTYLPLTKLNKKLLNMSEDTTLILVLGSIIKHGNRDYDKFISRISRNKEQIEALQSLFGQDLSLENLPQAINLVNQGLYVSYQVQENLQERRA